MRGKKAKALKTSQKPNPGRRNGGETKEAVNTIFGVRQVRESEADASNKAAE